MKILLFSEGQKAFAKSGVGRALKHQMKALELEGVEYTLNPKDEYDLVHINTVFQKSYRMLKKAKKNGKPVITHGHSTEEDFKNSFIFSNTVSKIFRKLLLRMYSNCDFLITPTPYTKQLLSTYEGVDCPIQDVSNGIDTLDFVYDEKRIEVFRKHFNLSKDQKVVIGVGLVIERKGFHDFVEIAKTMPDVTFIWFGSAPKLFVTKKIKRALRTKPKNVILPGYVTGDVLKGAYAGADVFFFPSYEENEGIVVLEALSSKQRVIVRDIPVYYDWMEHNKNCVKGTSNIEFTKLIEDILDEKYEHLREAARQTALERDLKIIGKELKAIYEKVLN